MYYAHCIKSEWLDKLWPGLGYNCWTKCLDHMNQVSKVVLRVTTGDKWGVRTLDISLIAISFRKAIMVYVLEPKVNDLNDLFTWTMTQLFSLSFVREAAVDCKFLGFMLCIGHRTHKWHHLHSNAEERSHYYLSRFFFCWEFIVDSVGLLRRFVNMLEGQYHIW